RRDPSLVRALAPHPTSRRRFVQRMRAGDFRSHGAPLRPRALWPALRGVAAPRRLSPRDRARHPQHGRGAQAHLGGDARPEDRDRRGRLRTRRRHLLRIVCGPRRRRLRRSRRRHHPWLSAVATRASRRLTRRHHPSYGSAPVSRLLYVLTALIGLASGVMGLLGMRGDAWRFRTDAIVPLGGLELAMDPLAGFFVALIGFSTAIASIFAVGYVEERHRGAGT